MTRETTLAGEMAPNWSKAKDVGAGGGVQDWCQMEDHGRGGMFSR